MKDNPMFESFTGSLRAASFGLVLALLTLLLSQGMGNFFQGFSGDGDIYVGEHATHSCSRISPAI